MQREDQRSLRNLSKFYADRALDARAIMPHVVSFETGMPAGHLAKLPKDDGDLIVQARLKALNDFEIFLELLRQVSEDLPQMLRRLLDRKNKSFDLARRTRHALGL